MKMSCQLWQAAVLLGLSPSSSASPSRRTSGPLHAGSWARVPERRDWTGLRLGCACRGRGRDPRDPASGQPRSAGPGPPGPPGEARGGREAQGRATLWATLSCPHSPGLRLLSGAARVDARRSRGQDGSPALAEAGGNSETNGMRSAPGLGNQLPAARSPSQRVPRPPAEIWAPTP